MGAHAKKKSSNAAQRDRADIAAERAAFAAEMTTLDASKLVFVDESGIRQGERVSYGYAFKGERCYETAPFRTGRRRNLLGWMRQGRGQVASWTGQNVTGDLFERWVRVVLVPNLRKGDVVIWDNARVHTPDAVALVEAAGARVLALPRYSPEFNPIEMMWSKVKHLVRRAHADTKQALEDAVAWAVREVTEEDSRGWIEHSGYVFPPAST